jgi:hypothetical protein
MAKTDTKVRHRPEFNGSKCDTTDQAETFRGYTERESFICSADEPTVSRIAEDLARIRIELEHNFDAMNKTLDNMTTQITDTKESINKTRAQIREL